MAGCYSRYALLTDKRYVIGWDVDYGGYISKR
jgi:hypothetical protein